MKTRVIVIAAALFAGMVGPSFALQGVSGMRAQSLATTVSCDVSAEDEQALCAAKCDDHFIRNSQNNMADHPKLAAEKKACDAKCGCPQNSK
jgi:hypothetical protein